MSRKRPGWRHRYVTQLEPSRAGATVGGVLGMLVFGALASAALLYRTDRWPEQWRFERNPPPDQAFVIAAAVLGVFALICALAAVVNARRWRLARRIERWSNDPRLVPYFPPADEPPPAPTIAPPPLVAEIVRARKLPKPSGRPRRVTEHTNIYGAPPIRIAYLRLFENRPRTRTFVEGAWREFGYVYLLRSASSVTPKEFRAMKRAGDKGDIFISTHEQLAAALRASDRPPLGKGRHAFRDVAPSTLRVRDRYGSYPMTALLCHGSFWKQAVDVLLQTVDLVVLDVSGLRPQNQATVYEMQRIIDRFPVEHVVLLADDHSNTKWLETQIRDVWSRMAAGSPNSTGGTRRILVAITDRVVRTHSTTTRVGPNGTTTTQSGPDQVRLVARRAETRRLAAMAQSRLGATTRPSEPAQSGRF